MEYANLKRKSAVSLLILSVFTAIEIIFCFTSLGSIPLGPGIVATLAHIPVIVSALALEKKYSFVMGFVMGLCSFIWWSTVGLASPSSFAFSPFSEFGNFGSTVICFVPRMLLPFFTSVIYNFLNKKLKCSISAGISAAFSTFLHSVMVLGLIYLFFAENRNVSETMGSTFFNFIILWSGVNSIVEITVAAIVGTAVAIPVKSLKIR